jgi:hypothetical protein
MNRGSRHPAERHLRHFRASDEPDAEQRAWTALERVYAERAPSERQRPRLRLALALTVLAVAGAITLTPAGATVHRWIDKALGIRTAKSTLFSLAAPGRLLVSGANGAWTIAADGSKRRLGAWHQGDWSPHGLYVAVAANDQLAALDPHGTVRWAIDRPAVHAPRWFYPSGYRIAYLSARTLRVINGDGTGDRRLAARVANVAPSWRPGHPYELSYATDPQTIITRDVDTGQIQQTLRLAARAKQLAWSADGARLLVRLAGAALVYDPNGRPVAQVRAPGRTSLRDAELSPSGRTLALLTGEDLTVTELVPSPSASRKVFTGRGLSQVAWSPDGRWLLISWPAANQWIFTRATGRPRIEAISRVTQQLPGGKPGAYPHIEGWCCTSPATIR